MSHQIIRVPLLEKTSDDVKFVLVEVKSVGDGTLDLQLTATESTSVFRAVLKQNRVGKLQASGSRLDVSSWTAVLEHVLLGKTPSASQKQLTDNVDIHASCESEPSLSLTVKKSVSGITQRLGSIEFGPGDEEDADLFQWAGLAVETSSTTAGQIADLKARSDSQQSKIDALQAQLDEFAERKKKEEDSMLEKFRQLLNVKKLKIRDQQRLLAGARVDPKTSDQVKTARSYPSKKAAGGSKTRKRKGQSASHDSDEGQATSAAEAMTDNEDAGMQSDERSDESDADETALEAGLPTTQRELAPGRHRQNAIEAEQQDELPPRRELNLKEAKGNGTSAASAKPEAEEEEDDEDTEDEL